jgi:uncharacterized protein
MRYSIVFSTLFISVIHILFQCSLILAQIPQSKFSQISIVIDDLGYGLTPALLQRLQELPLELNFSIIPGTPNARLIAEGCELLGRDYLAHIPWQPVNHELPVEAGLIPVDVSQAELKEIIEAIFTELPGIIAANNHQGSLASKDKNFLRNFAEVWRTTGLSFLDSKTHAGTKIRSVFSEFDIPVIENRLFLDHVDNRKEIDRMLDEAVRLSRRFNEVIVIAHPRRNTLDALTEFVKRVPPDVRLVSVSDLLKDPEQELFLDVVSRSESNSDNLSDIMMMLEDK